MSAEIFKDLSIESRSRLDVYATLLTKWQKAINLVGPATMSDVWSRHFSDSIQLHSYAGRWRHWVDLGSGAGFPGMVIAITSERSQKVHLIEADKRKAAFLREVSRETNANVEVHAERIERVLPELVRSGLVDIISARALAPLETLISYASEALDQGAVCLFLKGKDAMSELTPALGASSVEVTFAASQTDSAARIVIVRRQSSSTNFASRS